MTTHLQADDGDERIHISLHDGCRRPCGLADHRRTVTVRFCLYLVLFCASFVFGIFLGQNRHAQVSSSNAISRITARDIEDKEYRLPESVLLVGGAGFIGMHTALRLQSSDEARKVVAVDNFNSDVYSSELKDERASVLESNDIKVIKGDACDLDLMRQLVEYHNIQSIVYLASQAYVRNDEKVRRPLQYPPDNMDCIVSIFDLLRTLRPKDVSLVYASGLDGYKLNLANGMLDDPEEEKKMRYNEMIALANYKLYGISSVGLRFGTVVGAYGRPDMDEREIANKNQAFHSVDDIVERILIELGSFAPGFNVVKVPRKYDKKGPSGAMDDFLKWYNEEGGSEYARLSKKKKMPKQESSADKICFVTSLFSNNRKLIEREGPYSLANYTNIHQSFKYYYFTNVDAKQLPSNGWEIIQLEEMPFERFITQSRWPKFMGFRHETLQQCKAIIYSDANRPAKDLEYSVWNGLVEKVLQSRDGIMQDRRPSKETIFQEMHSIVERNKDIAANIDESKKWFLEQSDFHDNAQGWWNMAMIMDPSNPRLQELMTTLWVHYSQEEGSWRDQPLYRYLVDKMDIHPLDLRLEGGHSKFFARVKSSGKHHHYNANTNGVSWQ